MDGCEMLQTFPKCSNNYLTQNCLQINTVVPACMHAYAVQDWLKHKNNNIQISSL